MADISAKEADDFIIEAAMWHGARPNDDLTEYTFTAEALVAFVNIVASAGRVTRAVLPHGGEGGADGSAPGD